MTTPPQSRDQVSRCKYCMMPDTLTCTSQIESPILPAGTLVRILPDCHLFGGCIGEIVQINRNYMPCVPIYDIRGLVRTYPDTLLSYHPKEFITMEAN